MRSRTLPILLLSLAASVWLTARQVAGPASPQGAAVPELFVTADGCIACHNNLFTPGGEDVSIGSDWSGSMMANSARDPYWQAAVRRETLDHPSAQAAIEDECAKCHMPMMGYQAHAEGRHGVIFAHLAAPQNDNLTTRLATDGVSCSGCHQIRPDKLGTRESFVGGFTIDEKLPPGQRQIFGPYDVDPGRVTIMRSAALFEPVQSAHVQDSEVCATCHTLYTHSLDEAGNVIGELPEQVPYLEWRHSAYRESRSCQSCHMPTVEAPTAITGVWGQPREGFSRHVFRGGNFFMMRLLNRFRDELGVQALPHVLEAAAERTVRHLETSAARLSIKDLSLERGRLQARVRVENLAGHKLPTAYPSRRVWIRFSVRDGRDRIVFESGSLKPDGSIAGNDNDADPARYEPHYRCIEAPGQVQIYEAIMAGPDDRITTGLLTAVRFIKDNRILPDGFDKSVAEADVAVRGAAHKDEDFQASGDQLLYRVPVDERDGPFTVTAELWYQPIGYRWAHNLAGKKSMETDRFVGYYRAMADSTAALLARELAEVQ